MKASSPPIKPKNRGICNSVSVERLKHKMACDACESQRRPAMFRQAPTRYTCTDQIRAAPALKRAPHICRPLHRDYSQMPAQRLKRVQHGTRSLHTAYSQQSAGSSHTQGSTATSVRVGSSTSASHSGPSVAGFEAARRIAARPSNIITSAHQTAQRSSWDSETARNLSRQNRGQQTPLKTPMSGMRQRSNSITESINKLGRDIRDGLPLKKKKSDSSFVCAKAREIERD